MKMEMDPARSDSNSAADSQNRYSKEVKKQESSCDIIRNIKVENRDEGFADGSDASSPSPSASSTQLTCPRTSSAISSEKIAKKFGETLFDSHSCASSTSSSSNGSYYGGTILEGSIGTAKHSELFIHNGTSLNELNNCCYDPEKVDDISGINYNHIYLDYYRNCSMSSTLSYTTNSGDRPLYSIDYGFYDGNNNSHMKADDELEKCCRGIDSMLQQQQRHYDEEHLVEAQHGEHDSKNADFSDNTTGETARRRRCCSCIIDVSTPATLERDFYAWLNQNEGEGEIVETGSTSTCSCSTVSYSVSNMFASSIYYSPCENAVSERFNSADGGIFYYDSSEPMEILASNFFNSTPNSSTFNNMSPVSMMRVDESFGMGMMGPSYTNAGVTNVIPMGHYQLGQLVDVESRGNGQHQSVSQLSMENNSVDAANSARNGRRFATVSRSMPANGTTVRSANANPLSIKSKPIQQATNSNSTTYSTGRKNKSEKELQRGTNLYGRPYCPGRPLSMEERAKIVNLFHSGMKVNAISKRLCISHGCVSKIITRFRETGLLIPSSHSECRRRKRLLAAVQQQQHHHQQQILLQQQQIQHQQLLQQQKQFLIQQQQKQQQKK